MQIADTHKPLGAVIQEALAAMTGPTITLRRLMAVGGEQSLLFLAALLTLPFMIPVSIPGVSTVFGLGIILIAIGITTNRVPWLPSRLLDRAIQTEKLVPTLQRCARLVERIENFVKPRLHALSAMGLVNRLNGLAIIAGAVLLMLPLGLIPFSNTLPALSILFLCVGMVQRDGVFVLLGYLILILTIVYFSALAYLAFLAGQGVAGFWG